MLASFTRADDGRPEQGRLILRWACDHAARSPGWTAEEAETWARLLAEYERRFPRDNL